jgi:hypothetical protein
MAKPKFDLLPGETVVGVWNINYFLPTGQIWMGKCTVTDQRIVYHITMDAVALQQASNSRFLFGGSTVTVGRNSWIMISKSEVKQVEVTKKFMRNRFVLRLADGNSHTFGGGVFGGDIDKIVGAIGIKPSA